MKVNNFPIDDILNVNDFIFNIFIKIKQEFDLKIINFPPAILWDKNNINTTKILNFKNDIYEIDNHLNILYDVFHEIKTTLFKTNFINYYSPIQANINNKINTNNYDSINIFYDFKISDNDLNYEISIINKLVNIINSILPYKVMDAINWFDFNDFLPYLKNINIDNLIFKKMSSANLNIIRNFTDYNSSIFSCFIEKKYTKIIVKKDKKIFDIINYIYDLENNCFFININIYNLVLYAFDYKYLSNFKIVDLSKKELNYFIKKGLKNE